MEQDNSMAASGIDDEDDSPGSRIFETYRSLGNVSNHIPCILRHIFGRKENFVTSCLGRSFNTYHATRLTVLSTSGKTPEDINCMAADTYHVYTAAGNKIYCWRRGTELKHTYVGHDSIVICLLPFAENLISVDENSCLILWDIKTEEIKWTRQFNITDEKIIGLMHPATYLNKIIIWTQQGQMYLWNVNSNKMIYHFKGWGSSIKCVAQAPVMDVIAVALASREVILHNLKCDRTLFKLKCADEPTSLAFRTDGQYTLLVGSSVGTITMWDLEKKEVIAYVQNAHNGPVAGLQSFPKEPLFVSSSKDNSIKLWIFDMPDGSFRLLNSRDGHSQTPTRIRFRGDTNIVSTGEDSTFRLFNIYNETMNRCLSKKNDPMNKINKNQKEKVADDSTQPIIDFTSETVANPSHYDDMAACHRNRSFVTTWSINNTKQNNKILPLPKKIASENTVATCLYLTQCGQFVVVGYENGCVEKFNMQSHQHRRSYKRHKGTVTGVTVGNFNTRTVSGGVDNVLRISDFDTGSKIQNIILEAGVTFLFRSRTTNLVGVALENFEISIYDIGTSSLVRRLLKMSDVILDAKFSHDGKWITASTGDCLTRTWDVDTETLIDVLRTEEMVVSLDYSNDGQYLATVLSSSLGIVLWLIKSSYLHISLLPLPLDYEPPLQGINVPSSVSEEEQEDFSSCAAFVTREQIDEDFVTLNETRNGMWKNLLNLHLLKEKSKSSEPQTYVAPFFISTIMESGLDKENHVSNNTETSSKIAKIAIQQSDFGRLLMDPLNDKEKYDRLCTLLKNKSPSGLGSEIEALGPNGGGSTVMLNKFMEFLQRMFEMRLSCDLAQCWLYLFLKAHEQDIVTESECHQQVTDLFNVCQQIYFDAKQRILLSIDISNKIVT